MVSRREAAAAAAAASADDQLGAMVAAHQSTEDARAAELTGDRESREPRAVENRSTSEGGDLLRGLIPASGALEGGVGLGVRSVRVQESREEGREKDLRGEPRVVRSSMTTGQAIPMKVSSPMRGYQSGRWGSTEARKCWASHQCWGRRRTVRKLGKHPYESFLEPRKKGNGEVGILGNST